MLFIRHAPKQYKNGDDPKYPLDPDITIEAEDLIRNKTRNLLQSYGVPPRIITSPFLRTRRTAMLMQDEILKTTDSKVVIEEEPLIGEYLKKGKWEITENSLHPDTRDIYRPETFHNFYIRLLEFYRRGPQDAWYISHGIFIQQLAKLIGYPINHPSYLCGFKQEEESITLI